MAAGAAASAQLSPPPPLPAGLGSSSVAISAAGFFPKWLLLEPYVFRRDDDKSFPDETVAPIRASGTTTWGAEFSIAFSLARPPQISRLYAQLPRFPGPDKENPLEILATHRHLALVEVVGRPSHDLVQNFFIFKVNGKKPSSSWLTTLPLCTELLFGNSVRRSRRGPSNAIPRQLDWMSSGLWFGGDKEEFVVAELTLYVRSQGRTRTEAAADICFLRSTFNDHHNSRKWDTMRVPIPSATADDLWKFSQWQTDAVVPFRQWLCWVDYHQGILFWDVLHPAPTISFLWFPEDKYSLDSTLKTPCSGNCGVSVVDDGRLLKFAYVSRHDGGLAYDVVKPSSWTGFTITCHTLLVLDDGSMDWNKDYTVTSDVLPGHLQHGIPMFPRVDIDKPHLVHFLFCEFVGLAYEKMSLLCIDMSTNDEVSFYLYMDGNDSHQNDDKNFIREKRLSLTPTPFLPCEFPRFISWKKDRKTGEWSDRERKRKKDME